MDGTHPVQGFSGWGNVQKQRDAIEEIDRRFELIEARIEDALNLKDAVYEKSVNELNFWLTCISILTTLLGIGAAALGLTSLGTAHKARDEAENLRKEIVENLTTAKIASGEIENIKTSFAKLLGENLEMVKDTLDRTPIDDKDIEEVGSVVSMPAVRFLRENEKAPTPSQRFMISASYFKDRNFVKAQEVLLGLQREYPGEAKYVYSLGRLKQEQKELDEAIGYYDQAYRLDGNLFNSIMNKAICMRDKGKPLEAIKLILNEHVLEKAGSDIKVHLNAASFALDAGFPVEALSILSIAKTIAGTKPLPPQVLYNEACAYAMQENKNAASAALKQLLATNPEWIDNALEDNQLLAVFTQNEIRSLRPSAENM